MNLIDKHFSDLRRLDSLHRNNGFIKRVDPRVLLITTGIFIIAVMSFNKYEISGLLPFFLFPIILIPLSEMKIEYFIKHTLVAAPFVVMVGIMNPLFDQETMIQLGRLEISGGIVSFISLLIRFTLTVWATTILISIIGFPELCSSLERLRLPRVFVVQLMFLYRYIFVLTEELRKMVRARAARSFGKTKLGFQIYIVLLGQLLLRTLDRAERIHLAMCARGFTGKIQTIRNYQIGSLEIFFFFGWIGIFCAFRMINFSQFLGQVILEWFI